MKTILLSVLLVATLATGCDDAKNSAANPDLAGRPDLAPSCVTNPTTHEGLLNACTDAEPYDKAPFYPMLAPGGELPALP